MRKPLSYPAVNTVSFGFRIGRGRQYPMRTADQHNEIELNHVECGEMLFRRGVETVRLPQGATTVYWAAVPHQVVSVAPGTEISWAVIPLAWFLGWRLSPAFNKRIIGGDILRLDGASSRIRIPSFRDWAEDFSASSELNLAVRLEVESFFRRLAARDQDHGAIRQGPPAEELQSHHVERMIATITARFREPLSVEQIARSANLNPEYAMRLFRKRWGMTLGTFLQHQRVAEARRLLLLSDLPVIDVAFACGFQSLSRFYHAFKKQSGFSPRAYRLRFTVPDLPE
ncbi:helix-turn-helix domain-containing protein [Ruficoccus amylovorans]|uniref:Helix-turn-helix domain-containing protein n=1 Tax=Ruficoccus amylovorans TaxID=1804625 RepID=A0A842HL98_9BACT|nr:helix-turn-helix domain-containing protein [Ruficoccus amylovorans]MBC2595911.1 helix-turn-helix domain-containing protein [Ruficoccus amylovorans]